MIMARRLVTVISAAVGVGFGVCFERYRQVNKFHPDKTARTRFVWPTVTAKSVVLSPDSPILPPPSLSRTAEIMKFGFPSMDNIRTFEDYVVSYDKRNKVPNWVFEHLTKEKVKKIDGVKRNESLFFEDSSIHEYFRSRNDDYKKSGYDRGHLAAAANHRWSQKAMDQTFVLTNIAPQVGKGFNRDAWNKLEKFVRHLTKNYTNVYVCSGPLYLPRRDVDNKLYIKYEVIGKSHISVPTHFFKVVLCEAASGDLELLTFVMPNEALPDTVELKTYLLPLDRVERAAGLMFFHGMPKEKLKKINGKKI